MCNTQAAGREQALGHKPNAGTRPEQSATHPSAIADEGESEKADRKAGQECYIYVKKMRMESPTLASSVSKEVVAGDVADVHMRRAAKATQLKTTASHSALDSLAPSCNGSQGALASANSSATR